MPTGLSTPGMVSTSYRVILSGDIFWGFFFSIADSSGGCMKKQADRFMLMSDRRISSCQTQENSGVKRRFHIHHCILHMLIICEVPTQKNSNIHPQVLQSNRSSGTGLRLFFWQNLFGISFGPPSHLES